MVISLIAQAADAAPEAAQAAEDVTRLSIFQGYIGVFVVAFLVTLIATPIMRRLAISNGIVDHPTDPRKVHRMPVAYLGGVAVFLGIIAGIALSYFAAAMPSIIDFHPGSHLVKEVWDLNGSSVVYAPDGDRHAFVPVSIVLGLFIIMFVGLLDDVVGLDPRLKVTGQLVAAAALAYQDVGVRVAEGVIMPLAKSLGIATTVIAGHSTIGFVIPFGVDLPILGDALTIDLVYWAGAAVIAVFVLGGCNASNLIDGLDGLLTGVTAIASIGLLVIALGMAVADDGPRDAQRVVLCLALLGACLGFLPHNFNPATIFLGDCGSLLLGFCTVVCILTLGDTGKTQLVLAGLIIYAIPIIDTVLAIVRRKLAGKSISEADDQHLHHMLKRALGVKGAVLALYGIGTGFAVLGIAMSISRARVIYALALLFAAYIGVTAIKIARRKQHEEQARVSTAARAAERAHAPGPPPTDADRNAETPSHAPILGK